jgi:hypothetical protein
MKTSSQQGRLKYYKMIFYGKKYLCFFSTSDSVYDLATEVVDFFRCSPAFS